jgi:hypothetical protein
LYEFETILVHKCNVLDSSYLCFVIGYMNLLSSKFTNQDVAFGILDFEKIEQRRSILCDIQLTIPRTTSNYYQKFELIINCCQATRKHSFDMPSF